MQTDIYFLSYLAQFFLEWEMFQTKVVQKIKTHVLFIKTTNNNVKFVDIFMFNKVLFSENLFFVRQWREIS